MTDLMEVKDENRKILLDVLGSEPELDRFLNWLRSKDRFFEAGDPDLKRHWLEEYLREGHGDQRWRAGRD